MSAPKTEKVEKSQSILAQHEQWQMQQLFNLMQTVTGLKVGLMLQMHDKRIDDETKKWLFEQFSFLASMFMEKAATN